MSDLDKTSEQLGTEGLQLIYDICDLEPYRLPSSEGEKNAQEFIKQKMKEFGADEIDEVEFYCRAKFFKWWPKLSLLFYLISLVTFYISPLITILLIILMLTNVVLKLFSYSFLDVLFRKHESSNVIAKLHPKSLKEPHSTRAKRIIIVGGHIDSTYEFPLGRKYGKKMIRFYVFVFLAAFVWFLISLFQLIVNSINGIPIINLNPTFNFDWYFILVLILTPFVSWIAWNVVSTRPVQGANDNLSGVAVATGVLKYFSKNRLDNVEIWAISFGSEEGGMAGSKALSQRLLPQIKQGAFPAESLWVVNFDSIAQDAPLVIAKSEPMYRVKSHDPEVYNLMVKAAAEAGVNVILKKIDAGTDSAPFTRLGIPSVGIIAAGEDGIPANWHSREDIPENCDVKGIKNSLKLAIQFVQDVDKSL